MILNRIVTTKIIILISLSVYANSKPPTFCGWDPSWDDTYYPIIDQFALVDEENWAFLNCPDFIFCYDLPNKDGTDHNIKEWYNYFKGKFSINELQELVYKKSAQWLKGEEKIDASEKMLFEKINQKKYRFFKRYLLLAKGTEHLASDKAYDDGWYQGETIRFEDKSPWLEKAFNLMNDAPNQFFKNRVGFQIVKLAHYKQDNALAIRAFKKYLKLKDHSRYIYYRALEQVSGAYFNENQQAVAAQNYLSVFSELPDRRENCALSLRFLDWSFLSDNPSFLKELKHKDIYHFFKAYYGRGDALKEMEAIAKIDVNSPYLRVLTMRVLDDLQSQLFEHADHSYYYEEFQNRDPNYEKSIIKISENILACKDLEDPSAQLLLKALAQIKLGDYNGAKATLNQGKPWKLAHTHKKRLLFALDFMAIKSPNRQRINEAFSKLDADKDLNTYKPIVAAFYNHISALYLKVNPLLSAFIAIDYDSYSKHKSFNWSSINENHAYNYKLESKHPFLNIKVINSFDAFISLESHTSFEQTVLDRIKVDAKDFTHELRGTYYLRENELNKALAEFEAVKNPLEFWEEKVRPELFSGSIKEWMDVDFNTISDKIHLEYLDEIQLSLITNPKEVPLMFRENYADNKVKLTQTLIKLEALAKQNNNKAATYYYMLGNAWYNMSAIGWFTNNIYYIGNDSRNDLWSDYIANEVEQQDNPLIWAEDYFNLGIESKGNKEVKAKLTFMLSKTTSCYDRTWNDDTKEYEFYLCENHEEHFKSLEDNFSDTDYYKEVLKQCSWLRWYKSKS